MKAGQKVRRVVMSPTTRLIVGCIASCALSQFSDGRAVRSAREKPCCG